MIFFFKFPYNFCLDFRLPVILVKFICILWGTLCNTRIQYTFYRGKNLQSSKYVLGAVKIVSCNWSALQKFCTYLQLDFFYLFVGPLRIDVWVYCKLLLSSTCMHMVVVSGPVWGPTGISFSGTYFSHRNPLMPFLHIIWINYSWADMGSSYCSPTIFFHIQSIKL